MKTYIDVPFSATHRAKSMGARFDLSQKKWFVPDGVDLQLFREWLPKGLAEYWDRLGGRRGRR